MTNIETSGQVDVWPEKRRFLIDNADTGFELHAIDYSGSSFLYSADNSLVKVTAKQVKFGENGDIVVGGSDHGTVYVFNRRTRSTMQLLDHHTSASAQTITVRHILP